MLNKELTRTLYKECQSLSLLYVEDERDLSEAMVMTLHEFFASVSVAYNGQEGLALYEKSDFDIVLTDLMMPVMNGREMSRQIRLLNPEQSIIVLSAHEESAYLMELIEIGVYKFVQKPSNLEQLSEALLSAAIQVNYKKKASLYADETKAHLAESRELLRNIIDTVPVRIFWKDTDSRYLGCNTLFAKDAGFDTQNDLLGKNDFELSWEEQAQAYIDDDREVMQAGSEKINYEELQPRPDGKTRWLSISKTPLRNEKNEIVGVLGTYSDITAHKEAALAIEKAKEALVYQANYDMLTGLPNRVLFLDRLSQALKKSSRNASRAAVVFIDLDRFKDINDSLGHEVGDLVIKLLAERLKEQLRQSDTLARFGGDEFLLLLENIAEAGEVAEVVEKLIFCMHIPFEVKEHTLHLSLSAGISIFPDDGNSPETLIRNADTAMYTAKDEGRSTYSFYTTAMTEKTLSGMLMSKNIRRALENKEFMVYYQAQIDAQTKSFLGMEALIRWKNSEGKFISPAEFIPVAEAYGLIHHIGNYVFEEACRQITQWHAKGYRPGHISINMSAIELQREDFVQNMKNTMSAIGCRSEWIELEITEGYMMKHPRAAITMLQEIKELGIRLSVDDFGTGYSSLSYLTKLPVHKLKIDQSFVREVPGNSSNEAIVESIISLARAMRFDVIAEGVETAQQEEFLLQKGCHNMQGYFYARPMPADEMEKFILQYQN